MLAIILYFVITYVRVGKALTTLTQEEFIQGYRKAQLIDIREPKDFDAGHILGARNIPFTQFTQRYREIRPDKPIYLYDQNTSRTGRAALFLKKKVVRKSINYVAGSSSGQARSKQNNNTRSSLTGRIYYF